MFLILFFSELLNCVEERYMNVDEIIISNPIAIKIYHASQNEKNLFLAAQGLIDLNSNIHSNRKRSTTEPDYNTKNNNNQRNSFKKSKTKPSDNDEKYEQERILQYQCDLVER